MKKILSIALIFILCFTLFACGDENNTDQTTTTTTATQSNTTTTTTQNSTTTNPNSYPKRFEEKGYSSIIDEDTKEAIITGVDDTLGGDIIIPSTLGGCPVTTIGDWAFRDNTQITSITFPESVKSFYYDVFEGCTGLKRVYFKDFKTFCEMDFGEKSNPLGYSMEIYFDRVKFDFTGEVVIPEGVENIGNFAFFGCPATSITLPTSLKSTGMVSFGNCDNLKRVNISDLKSYFEIDFGYQGHPLTYGDLYVNGTKINTSGNFVIPEGVKRIGSYALSFMDNITSVTIPSTVTCIGSSAFACCRNLESITIPGSVKNIEYCAFDDCKNLKRVNITDLDAWSQTWMDVVLQTGDYVSNGLSADPLCYGAELYLNGTKVYPDNNSAISSHRYTIAPMFKACVPQIVGNTTTIKKLNDKIMDETLYDLDDDYNQYSSAAHLNHYLAFNKGETFDFDYIVKNNVLVIYVYSTVPEGSNLPGQSGDGLYRNSYYYDVTNDKILSTSQAVDKLGVAIPGYADLNNFPLDGGGWLILINNNELTLEFFI